MTLRPGSLSALRAPALPPVVLARDQPDNLLAARVAAGELARVARGTYLGPERVAPHTAALARIIGAHAQLTGAHVFSHTSAALLHGLPLWRTPTTTHVRVPGTGGGRRDRKVVRHVPLPHPDEVDRRGGLPVTSLDRTVWDCLVTLPVLDGMVVTDAALRAGLDRDALLARAAASRGVRGVARARTVLAHADAGAESAGETVCRWALLRDGFPPPETQVRVDTRLGTFWLDLGWREWEVAVEYDGRVKYTGTDALPAAPRR